MTAPQNELVLVLDFGAKETQLIARRIREASVYCEVHPFTLARERVSALSPRAIVLVKPRDPLPFPEDLGLPTLRVDEALPSGETLRTFLFEEAKLAPTWTASRFAEEAIAGVRAQVGPEEQAICGLSGGVDSSVAALLCHRALGDRLTCVFVDTGMMREGESEEVVRVFRDSFQMKLVHVDARQRFLSELSGVTDPEQKRKIIGRVFIEVFEEEAAKVQNAKWLVQGTIYPDVIESVSIDGKVTVKSHHNVGGLPERMKLGLVEPLRQLFKDEVRRVGEALGMPEKLVWRHPFPGPGLAVRCLGSIEESRLSILRKADAIVEEEIRKAGLYGSIWQSFAALLPVRAVGQIDGKRTFGEVIAIRAVKSTDAMTAEVAELPYEVLGKMASRIMLEVPGISRVVYDISPKPPGTIEWE